MTRVKQYIKTKEVHDWMKSLDDKNKQWFAINWRMPHTLFNVACRFRDERQLQGIDWYRIYQSRDLGTWSHGGKVIVGNFGQEVSQA